jgi:hypothetical protein
LIDLAAIEAGRSLLSRLPGFPCGGTVHSAFGRAINVTWGSRCWISILGPSVPLSPWSVRVPRLPSARPGDPCRISRGEILFGERRLRIRLDDVCPIDLRILPREEMDPDLLATRGEHLGKWLATRRLPPSLLDCLPDPPSRSAVPSGEAPAHASNRSRRDPLLRRASDRIDGAWRSANAEERARRLTDLVGLGAGLTPAGDDFLVGVLAASALTSRLRREREILAGTLPALAGTRTTGLSASMLEAACGGEFALPVVRLVESLGRPGNGVLGAARDLLALGATSGADTLAGVLFAVSTGSGKPT